jgi:hypothetical protein
LLRALGAGPVGSWHAATLVVLIIGIAGTLAVGRETLRTRLFSFVFVALVCISYPFNTQMGHVQTAGYLLVCWPLWACLRLSKGTGGRTQLAILLLVPPALAMSSWYAFLLVACGLVLWLFLALALRWPHRLPLGQFRQLAHEHRAFFGACVFLSTALLATAAYIFLPAAGIGARAWAEVATYSPELGGLVNASGLGGGIWAPLYKRMGLAPGESAMGLTPLLLSTVLAISLHFVRRSSSHDGSRARVDVRVQLIALVVFFWLLVLRDSQNHSLWYFPWRYLPVIDSLRVVFRGNILVCWILMWIIAVTAERVTLDSFCSRRGRPWFPLVGTVVLLLAGAIACEQLRLPPSGWTSGDYLPAQLAGSVERIRADCDTFALLGKPLREPGTAMGAVLSHIDAVALSVVTKVPTANGYSGSAPERWPKDMNSPKFRSEIIRWAGDTPGRFCLVDASTGAVRIETE